MRVILTNKATGSQTYLEAADVDSFFAAGANRGDYEAEDEFPAVVEVAEPMAPVVPEVPAETPVPEVPTEEINHG